MGSSPRSTRPARAALLLAGAAVVLLSAAPGAADWPTARHDARRTGLTWSPSGISKPAQYWRAYLGGSLGAQALLVDDVDGDGALDVTHAAGGRLALARPDGSLIWQTENLGIVAIADAVDLDLDGTRDVVARTSTRALVVNGKTGAVAWQQPEGEMGTLSAARIADLDGDLRPDLFLDRCGCCAVEGPSPGEIYSFAAGFGSPVKLGPLPARDHCNAAANTVGDWDGDGALDLLLPTADALMMVRPDGQALGTSAPITLFIGGARCEAADVDGVPGDEALCLHNVGVGSQAGRRVFALTYRPAESPAVQLLWEAILAPADGELRAPGRLLVDLDQDGAPEVVASGKDSGAWTTHVLDPATGAPLATLPGQLAHALVPVPGAGMAWFVTSQDETVHGFRYFGNIPDPFILSWTAEGRRVPTRPDRSRDHLGSLSESPVLPELDGDPATPELVLEATAEPGALHAYALDPVGLSEVASYPLQEAAGVVALAVPPPQLATEARLAISRNDGYLALVDSSFTTLNPLKEGNETLPGMRIGAYGTGSGGLFTFGRAPIAARLEAGAPAESVLVVDARGDLVRIDALEASNVSPARPTWRLRDSFGASIAPLSVDSPARIGCFRRRHPLAEPPSYALAVVHPEGHELASVPLQKPPAWDVVPGDLEGDGTLDFAALTVDSANATELVAMRATGTPLWQSSFTAQFGTSPIAIDWWDQNGTQDVVLAINSARVLSGASGAVLADSGNFLAYFMPLLEDVNSDGEIEITLQGGLYPARTLTHDLGAALWQGPDDRPYPYGAVAHCASPTLVEGSLQYPARLSLTTLSGPDTGARTSVVLAGGEVYPDEAAAIAAGAQLGQLGDVSVSMYLNDSDATPTALVGSTDGFLYAVDACSATLRWSHRFEAPVGSPILADTDGDGHEDIVVSVADGYLYALRNEALPAPESVWDVDIPRGLIDDDLDEIETATSLHAIWSPVPGATSYELALVGAAGTYLTVPPWIDVGAETSASISGLQLEDGAKYYVGVRAVGPAGRSPDRPSDGVIVRLGEEPLTGAGGSGGNGGAGGNGGGTSGGDDLLLWGRGCACRVGGADAAGGELAALGMGAAAVGMAVMRRRRRVARAARGLRRD